MLLAAIGLLIRVTHWYVVPGKILDNPCAASCQLIILRVVNELLLDIDIGQITLARCLGRVVLKPTLHWRELRHKVCLARVLSAHDRAFGIVLSLQGGLGLR